MIMAHTPERQPQGQHPDRAVCNKDEDRYGFTYIATELARAIQGIGREGSDTPLVASLLLPVAGIIAQEEEKRLSSRELKALKKKKRVTCRSPSTAATRNLCVTALIPSGSTGTVAGGQ